MVSRPWCLALHMAANYRRSPSATGMIPGSATTSSQGSVATSPPSAARGAPIQAYKGSSSSIVTPENGATYYGYYQDLNGNIIETDSPNTSFVATSSSIVVAAADTYGKSPLAATAWTGPGGTVLVSPQA
jgi:hypothetical protein